MYKAKWLVVVLSGFLCVNADAKLYKWVDDNGTTHYGETIPPEYANKEAIKLTDKGREEKPAEKLTPEAQREKEAENDKKLAAKKAAIEQKRRDTALLSTFSNENEIDLALNRSLQQVEARINSFTTMLKSAQASLAEHRKEQSDLLKQNMKIPKSLLEDIQEGEDHIGKLQKDLDQNQQELVNVKARFESDKQRYRELKGIKK